MQKGLKEPTRGIPQYVDHRVFATKFDHGPNAVVKLADPVERVLFIPAGSESQNPNRNLDIDETPFGDVFKLDDLKLRRSASVIGHHYA